MKIGRLARWVWVPWVLHDSNSPYRWMVGWGLWMVVWGERE